LCLIAQHDLGSRSGVGRNAPSTASAVLSHVRAARKRGFSLTADLFAPAMSSMAAPVFGRERDLLAILIIAGPSARLTKTRMLCLAPALIESAAELASASGISPMLRPRPDRPPGSPSLSVEKSLAQ
jgi:DNA-binding IclR family transcriptional regulator